MANRSCFISIYLFLITAITSSASNCLWKVTSENSTLYLQGSIHALKAEAYPLDPAIEKAYAESDILVLETDIAEMRSTKTQQRILACAQLPPGQTLQKTVKTSTWQEFSAACEEIGAPPTTLNSFKPWSAAMALTLIRTQQLGLDPEYGIDFYFYKKAVADEKGTVGLETVDFQIKLFDSLDREDPDTLITRTLTSLHVFEEEFETLFKVWKTGEIEAIEIFLKKEFSECPERHKSFVLDRNKHWHTKLKTYLKSPQTHFVVVGIAHLPGKGGLLELFAKSGFNIEQL